MPQVSDTTKAWMPFDPSRRSTSIGRRPSASSQAANTVALEFLKAHEGKNLKDMSIEDVARLSKDPRSEGGDSTGRWRRLSLNAPAVSGMFAKSESSQSRSRSISRDRAGSRDRSLSRDNKQSMSSVQTSTSAPRGVQSTRSPTSSTSSSRGIGAFVKSFSMQTSDTKTEMRGSTHSNVDAQILNRLALRRSLVSQTTRVTSKDSRRSVTPSPSMRFLAERNNPGWESKSNTSSAMGFSSDIDKSAGDLKSTGSATMKCPSVMETRLGESSCTGTNSVVSSSSLSPSESNRRWLLNRIRTECGEIDAESNGNRSKTTTASGTSSLRSIKLPKQEYRATDAHSKSLDSIPTDEALEVRSYVAEGVKTFRVDRGDLLEDFVTRRRSTDVSSRISKSMKKSSRHGSRRSSVGDKLLASQPRGVPLTLAFPNRRSSIVSLLSDADDTGLGWSEHSKSNLDDLFPEKKEEEFEDQYVKNLLFETSDS